MSLLQNLIPPFARTPTETESVNARESGAAVRPAYDLNETEDAFRVTVQLPGVSKDGLEIASEDGVLTVVGRRTWKRPDGWTPLYRESADVGYRLALQHDASVDVDKIQAELRDGVLRITLPKSEAVKPRKIAVG